MKEGCCLLLVALLALSSCKKDDDNPTDNNPPVVEDVNTIPEFYSKAPKEVYGVAPPTVTEIGSATNRVVKPQDLDFHSQRTDELWVINEGTENTGGSTVLFFKAGTGEQTSEYRQDENAWHFMSLPTAMEFGNNGDWATTTGVLDANHQGGTYTGPSLWSGNLSIYARPSGFNGSHLDMLHGSPYSMGIAHDVDNVYWVYDGYYRDIVRYDFAADHGPGHDDHSDGKVHRYSDLDITRNPKAPSHMVLDKATGWLYICDNGNKRVLRLNTRTGTKETDLPLINEALAEHWRMKDYTWEVFKENFSSPTGIEIVGNRLFVTDSETGDIIAYNVDTKEELGRIKVDPGVRGISIGPDGKLWFVNYNLHKVYRIDPK